MHGVDFAHENLKALQYHITSTYNNSGLNLSNLRNYNYPFFFQQLSDSLWTVQFVTERIIIIRTNSTTSSVI